MSKSRPNIPNALVKRLMAESRGACANCKGHDTLGSTLEFHHIIPWREVREHSFKNMIALCRLCHAHAETGLLRPEKLRELKTELSVSAPPPSQGGFTVSGNNNLVANNGSKIYLQSPKRKPRATPPSDSVGASAAHWNYLKYLMDRYVECSIWNRNETSKSAYSRSYQKYKRMFRCDLRNTPLDHFDEAAAWLQGRILQTQLGKVLKSRQDRVFVSFDEHRAGRE